MAKYAPLRFIEHCEEYRKGHEVEEPWSFIENYSGVKFPYMTYEKILSIALSPIS